MRINNNLMAMNTHRQLAVGNSMASKSMEKLSSGYRINRAGDDAAGLAISEKMRAQIRGLNQASRNAQDSISMIQTAEGALQETQSILQRMRELAVQAANDTNNNTDRGAIQDEIDQLTDEIDRIARNTEFNNKKLLNGDLGTARAATSGVTEGQSSLLSHSTNLLSAVGVFTDNKVGTYEITLVDGLNSVVRSGTNGLSGLNGTETLAELGVTNLGAFTAGADNTGEGPVDLTGLSLNSTVIDFVNTLNNHTGLDAELNSNGEIEVYQATAGATITGLTDAGGSDVINQLFGGASADAAAAGVAAGAASNHLSVKFTDASGNETTTVYRDTAFVESAGTNTNTWNGITFTVSGADMDAGDTFTIEGLQAKDALSLREDGSVAMQIGANENQTMSVDIEDMTASALGVRVSGDSVSITTKDDAAEAITKFNDAIESVSAERAKLGAVQNRLEHSIKNLDTSSENLQAAESRIRDVDMAKEMMEFTKNNILQQAAQSMLAQANQAPQGVLQLLR